MIVDGPLYRTLVIRAGKMDITIQPVTAGKL